MRAVLHAITSGAMAQMFSLRTNGHNEVVGCERFEFALS